MQLDDHHRAAETVHPALDVVGDTLCVTVLASVGGRQQFVVLTSDGDLYRPDEWVVACAARQWQPIVGAATPHRCRPRWHGAGIRETLTALHNARACPTTWADTYAAIHAALDARLQVCDERYLALLAVYAMMTYVHPLFDFLPILHLRGPAESGKSRAAHTLARLCFNGATFGSATDATLFRYAHEGRYTQIVTEADHLATLSSGHSFVKHLQSACSKAEANVDRAEARGNLAFVPATYHTFSPRVLLSTQPFRSQPLRSRCIRLDLVKSPGADQTKLRASVTDDAVWAPLRDQLYRLLLQCWREVRDARDQVKASWIGAGAPTGRTFDKWLPLVTLARLVGPEVETIIRELAAEDGLEHQRNATDRQEAHIALFALWLVHGDNYGRDVNGHPEDRALSRQEIYDAFLASPSSAGDRPWLDREQATPVLLTLPQWARDTDVPATAMESLRRTAPNKDALIREFARLHLIDATPKHTRTKNVYHLQQTRVEDVAKGIIGEEEVARVLADLEQMEAAAA